MVQPSALWKGTPQGRRKVGGTKGKPQSSRTQWARSLPLTTQPENHIALNISAWWVFFYILLYIDHRSSHGSFDYLSIEYRTPCRPRVRTYGLRLYTPVRPLSLTVRLYITLAPF